MNYQYMGRNFSLSLLILLFFPFFVYAQDNPDLLNINVEGQAVIKQNDITGAREEAIKEALGNAVEIAAANLLSISIKDKKFQSVRSAVIDEQDKYISVYRISEERKEKQTYIVNVNATVVMTVLKDDLNKKGFFQPSLTKEESCSKVFLNVRGLKEYVDYLRLKEFLMSRTKIVKSIYPCRFTWQETDCEIEIYGSVQSFADELNKEGGYLMREVEKVDKNHIEINCMNKERI